MPNHAPIKAKFLKGRSVLRFSQVADSNDIDCQPSSK